MIKLYFILSFTLFLSATALSEDCSDENISFSYPENGQVMPDFDISHNEYVKHYMILYNKGGKAGLISIYYLAQMQADEKNLQTILKMFFSQMGFNSAVFARELNYQSKTNISYGQNDNIGAVRAKVFDKSLKKEVSVNVYVLKRNNRILIVQTNQKTIPSNKLKELRKSNEKIPPSKEIEEIISSIRIKKSNE